MGIFVVQFKGFDGYHRTDRNNWNLDDEIDWIWAYPSSNIEVLMSSIGLADVFGIWTT